VDGRTYVRTDVRTYWRTFQTPLWRSVNLICGALEEHLLTHSNAIRLTRRSRPNNSRLCRILKYKQYLGKCNWLTLVTKIWTLWHCDNDATFLGKVNTLEQNARVITKHRHESTTLKVQKTILIGVYRHNSSVSEIYHTTKKCAGSWDYQILLQKQGNAFMLALENIYRHIVIFFVLHKYTYLRMLDISQANVVSWLIKTNTLQLSKVLLLGIQYRHNMISSSLELSTDVTITNYQQQCTLSQLNGNYNKLNTRLPRN